MTPALTIEQRQAILNAQRAGAGQKIAELREAIEKRLKEMENEKRRLSWTTARLPH
jgi:hypothetical protein